MKPLSDYKDQMPTKTKIEFVSEVYFYKCFCVGENWQEEYSDDETVLKYVSGLIDPASESDFEELRDNFFNEIEVDDQDGSLPPYGDLYINDKKWENENSIDDYSLILEEEETTYNDFYQEQIANSKLCVIQVVQNKNHIAGLEIDGPFDLEKLSYENGWLMYDGEALSTEESQGNSVETLVFVDGDDPSNLSFIIKKTPNGLYIPNAYMKLLEVEDGTEYEIKLGREAIRLVPITDEED
jgi:hypothetical protein